MMSDWKYLINSDGIVRPETESENRESKKQKIYSISKDSLPSLKKILVTDDGKDMSDKAINYAVSLSNSTGAELLILRIVDDTEKLEDVSVEGSNTNNTQPQDQKFKRTVKGEIIDSMEEKIKKCQDVGCQYKVSYKFLVGNPVDEIVKEINENNNNYDLIVLTTSHIDSWFSSLFSDARKIISHISKPVLIVQ